jgi:DNA-binding NarL/FixJ family response regulator
MGRATRAGVAVTDADYNTMANQHRPTDPASLAAEIRRLHADGLTSRDIAEALRLSHAQVITILYGEPERGRITEHR